MKRKVIKQANQAYTITLPINWARENNVSNGSELDVEESGKSLIISNQKGIRAKKTRVDVSSLDKINISRIISSLYSKGVDEIELISDKDISSMLNRRISSTIGYAIIGQDKERYVINDISGSNYSDLDEIFKRVFQMVLSFYDSAIKDVFGKQEEKLENLERRDEEINKFCLFLQRAVNKMSYQDSVKARVLFTYSFELEKIGDEVQRFWRTNIKYPVRKSESIKKLALESYDALANSFDLVFSFNPKIAEKVYLKRQNVREASMKLKEVSSTARLIRHIIKISEEANDLNQLAFMLRIEES